MHVPRCCRARRLPLRHLASGARVVMSITCDRARPVVREIHVRPELRLLVDEAECTPAVTPSVNSLIAFGCSGSCVSAMTMPFLRSAAPSRVKTM